MDTHVNVALHKYIFVSSPSKNNKIYLDTNDTFISWHTYIAHYKNRHKMRLDLKWQNVIRWEWIGFDIRKYIGRSQDHNLFLIPFGQTSMKYNFSKKTNPDHHQIICFSTQSIKFKNRMASHEIRKYSRVQKSTGNLVLDLKWQFSRGREWGREGCHSH